MSSTKHKSFRLQKRHMDAVRLIFEGHSIPEIAGLLFDIRGPDGLEDAKKRSKAEYQIRHWCDKPEFVAAYRKLEQLQMMPRYSKALRVFDKQMNDPNPWVAQGAAREIVSRFGAGLMGETAQEIKVTVSGMPELGVPEEE